MASGVIHIRDIRAIRVQYLSREKFDGTLISLITRILCNGIYPHSAYSGNPCSIYFTHINSIEYELHGCALKGRAQCHSQCHSQCLTHYYYYLCPPHPHCIIKTFRCLSISFSLLKKYYLLYIHCKTTIKTTIITSFIKFTNKIFCLFQIYSYLCIVKQ